MFIVKIIENNTVYITQELHLWLFSFSVECNSIEVISAIFASSIFSVHFSISLSTNLLLHLQFSQSKYSATSHDLSHSHSQLLGFQIPIHIHLYQLILHSQPHLHVCIHTCIYNHSNVVYYYKRLHLICIYIYMFHVILLILFYQFLALD